jgi:AcrR family transcriptional regulator
VEATTTGAAGTAGTAGPADTIGRRERKKVAVRERILAVAADLIAADGLADTTVDRIAERADISQATFFNYFPSKRALVESLIDLLLTQFDRVVDEAHGVGATATAKLQALFQISAQMGSCEHRLLRDIIAESLREPTDRHYGSLGRVRSVFAGDIAESQERGEVRSDRSAEALADATLGLYVSVFLFWTADAAYPVADRLVEAGELAIELMANPG